MIEVKTTPATPVPDVTPEPPQPSDLKCFSLAHISDLHLTTLKHVKIHQLLSKRMFGYFSWWRKRRVIHSLDIVESLLLDLRDTQPDHIAVTGDLTHLGLLHEFAEARHWLTLLGAPEQVSVIPGNHEAYAGRDWVKSCAIWVPYLSSDGKQDVFGTANFFPSLRIRGQVALIGLCSASPSLPFLATGSLGKKQLTGLEELLKKTGEAGLMRVILIHHPPAPGTIQWRKRLIDSSAFCDVLMRHGAELVLHGHTHFATLSELPTPAGNIPVIGAPSASELSTAAGRGARYNVYRLKRAGLRWELAMSVRAYSAALGRFVAEETTTLSIPHIAPTTNHLHPAPF